MKIEEDNKRSIVILGSTGSIGTQTLDIVREYPERFRVEGLTARRNWELLADQAREFMPRRVTIAEERFVSQLRDALRGLPIKITAGDEAVAETAAMTDADTVVTAMVGYSGLLPTIRAIGAGKRIALANKETLVVAGELITGLLAESESEIVPVDSEHSAIFQCLEGESRKSLRKIILTASGGPFRTLDASALERVTVADALRHPNWQMGAKVTIDSASMMNKGFEMIEARWLFDCTPDKIDILVHPQSVVHSMVELIDGTVKAQLGVPDMHMPIRYALGYPNRLDSTATPLSFADYPALTFEKPDKNKFPLLQLAFDAIETGGVAPCVLNAANEIAVEAFLTEKIGFNQMATVAEKTLERMMPDRTVTLETLVATNNEARAIASEIADSLRKS